MNVKTILNSGKRLSSFPLDLETMTYVEGRIDSSPLIGAKYMVGLENTSSIGLESISSTGLENTCYTFSYNYKKGP